MKQAHVKPRVGIIGLKGLPAFGGAATVGENLVRHMNDRYDFVVYATSSHADPDKDMMECGFRQIVFKRFFIKKLNIFVYYIKSAFHAIFKVRYDIVHIHHIDGAFILPLLRLKYKVICTSHARPQLAEKWPWYVKAMFSMNERIVFLFANTLVTVSQPLKEFYRTRTNRVVHYVPNGVDVPIAHKAAPVRNQNILFAAGRIIPLKGLHLLLTALNEIRFQGLVQVIGDLNQMPSYRQTITELSRNLNTDFPGLIREKQRLLEIVEQAGLFVFPSLSENMSMMMLEVASLKTPMICSDIPANKAVFSDDEVLFFRSGDEADLANKIRFALENQADMVVCAEKAYSRLSTDFTWNTIAGTYIQLYQNTLTDT
jgi:glycosyltransferase involved in cell wall biosynthesis